MCVLTMGVWPHERSLEGSKRVAFAVWGEGGEGCDPLGEGEGCRRGGEKERRRRGRGRRRGREGERGRGERGRAICGVAAMLLRAPLGPTPSPAAGTRRCSFPLPLSHSQMRGRER